MTDSESPPDAAPGVITELVGVYDADGGLTGEAKYVVGHLLGRLECALCDITHGPVWRKRSFDAFRTRLGVPFEVVHRNQRGPELLSATGDALPAVVASVGDRSVVVMDPDALAACGGDVARFDADLRDAVAAAGLSLPVA